MYSGIDQQGRMIECPRWSITRDTSHFWIVLESRDLGYQQILREEARAISNAKTPRKWATEWPESSHTQTHTQTKPKELSNCNKKKALPVFHKNPLVIYLDLRAESESLEKIIT